jgi:hypothetical protein
MNARIKELAERAGWWKPPWASPSDWNDGYVVTPEQMKKFAELLIKDCADICEDNAKTYKYSFKPAKAALAESAANHCAMLIKRTYGVE